MYSSRVDFFFFVHALAITSPAKLSQDVEKASRLTKVEKVHRESFGGICFEQNIRFVICSVGK